MKKLIVGALMAALMSLGLVAGASTPATAIDCNTVYTGCVIGKLRVNKFKKIRFGERNKFRVRVTVPNNQANRTPTGTIALKFKRKGGGYSYKFPNRAYTGQPLFYTTPKLKVPGRYKIIAVFTANAPYQDLKNAKKSFVVKPKGFRG